MAATPIFVKVQAEDFDTAAEVRKLAHGRTDIGAVVTFTGLCRGEAATLAALELEHYPGMAEEELARTAGEASARWPLDGITVIHRYGKIAPGENIVLVVTCSAHRQAAFEAAEYLMDYLKNPAPFWKKERRADGTSAGWVDARDADDEALKRW